MDGDKGKQILGDDSQNSGLADGVDDDSMDGTSKHREGASLGAGKSDNFSSFHYFDVQ